MYIDTLSNQTKLLSHQLSNTTVIVVDVLRATTSIICAVMNGANLVVPTADPGSAAAFSTRIGSKECILAGERGGVKLPDFALGNSPSEFSADNVRGKTVIMSTTNGTAAINSVGGALDVLIGALINKTAVAEAALKLNNDVLIVCAGTNGRPSADDICAAGGIAKAISELAAGKIAVTASDMTLVACMIYTDWKEGRADLSVTKHYSHLCELGFKDDVDFAFTEDITDVVPRYSDGVIKS